MWSAIDNWDPRSANLSAMYDQKLKLADSTPYRALVIKNVFPSSAPNSGPVLIHTFSYVPLLWELHWADFSICVFDLVPKRKEQRIIIRMTISLAFFVPHSLLHPCMYGITLVVQNKPHPNILFGGTFDVCKVVCMSLSRIIEYCGKFVGESCDLLSGLMILLESTKRKLRIKSADCA
jgi:hypothetical protein